MRKSVFMAHVKDAARQRGGELREYLRMTRELGYEGLECDYADLAADPAGFAAMLAEAGLEVASVPYFFEFEKHLDPVLIQTVVRNVAAAGGRKILAIPGELGETYPNALECMVEGLDILCREAAEQGITVTLEDFGDVKSPCSTAEGLQYFFDRVPALKFNLDTGNFLCMGQDVLKQSRPLMGRVAHVHLKDWDMKPLYENESFFYAKDGVKLYSSPVGYGVIPMEAAITMAKNAGYEGFCSAEHYDVADQWDYIVKSAAWMNKYL